MDLIKMGLRWDEVQPKRRADLFKCALLKQPAWRHFMTCSEEREEERKKEKGREKLHRHASWRSQLCNYDAQVRLSDWQGCGADILAGAAVKLRSGRVHF